jgi:hypothetical protein
MVCCNVKSLIFTNLQKSKQKKKKKRKRKKKKKKREKKIMSSSKSCHASARDLTLADALSAEAVVRAGELSDTDSTTHSLCNEENYFEYLRALLRSKNDCDDADERRGSRRVSRGTNGFADDDDERTKKRKRKMNELLKDITAVVFNDNRGKDEKYESLDERRTRKFLSFNSDSKNSNKGKYFDRIEGLLEEISSVTAEDEDRAREDKTRGSSENEEDYDKTKQEIRKKWIERIPRVNVINMVDLRFNRADDDDDEDDSNKLRKSSAKFLLECLSEDVEESKSLLSFVVERNEDNRRSNRRNSVFEVSLETLRNRRNNNSSNYFEALQSATEDLRAVLATCERADLTLKKRLYERMDEQDFSNHHNHNHTTTTTTTTTTTAVEMFAKICCLLPLSLNDGLERDDDDDSKNRIALASQCLQILSRRGYAEACANALIFVQFEIVKNEKLIEKHVCAKVIDSVSDKRACCKIIESIFAVFGKKSYTNAARDCEFILREILLYRFWKCETTKYYLSEEILLNKGCPRNVLPALIRILLVRPLSIVDDFNIPSDGEDVNDRAIVTTVDVEKFKHDLIANVCELWASKNFVVGSSSKSKGHLAATMNAILITSRVQKQTEKEQTQNEPGRWESFICGSSSVRDGAKLTSYIVDGVSVRLESSSAQSRAHARRIAKEFSLTINPNKPLDLDAPVDGETDLLDDDDDDDAMSDKEDDRYHSENEAEWESNVKDAMGEYDASKVLPSSFYEIDDDDEGEEKNERKKKKTSKANNAVVEIDENDDINNGVDDINDDEFQAYDIDSDDDDELTQKQSNAKNLRRHLKQLPKPRTLREALNALRRVKPSQHFADADLADAQEGAVYAMAEMFENSPDELFSVADQFSIALLHANPPTPSTKALEISRMNGLTKLFENAPEESIPTAIGHAFDGTTCDASHKLELLCCISQAAKTLSALPSSLTSYVENNNNNNNYRISQSSSPRDSNMNNGSKTRVFAPKALQNRNRYGGGLARVGHRTRSAIIGPTIVAPLLVSLSSQLQRMSDLSSSIGSEAMVLSAMLDCIGECCYRTQNAVNSYNTALAALGTITAHDAYLLKHCDPSVRSSALVACARALLVVPDIMAKEELMLTMSTTATTASAVEENSDKSKLFDVIEKITTIAKHEHVRGIDEQCRSAGVFATAATHDVVKRATECATRALSNDDGPNESAPRVHFVFPKAENNRFRTRANSVEQITITSLGKLHVSAQSGIHSSDRGNVRLL